MIDKIINHRILLYFAASIIPLLSISIFLADLILSILSILFLVFLIKNNPSIFYKNFFFLISLSFYFLSIISSFFSQDIFFSLKSSLPLIRIIIFIFLINYLIENKKETVDILFFFIKYSFLILVLYGLIFYSIEYINLILSDELNTRNIRLKLPISDEEKLGSYLVRLYGIFFALYLLKEKRKKSENFLFYFLTLLTSLVILLSGERTSLFFMILFCLLCVFLLNFNLKTKFIYFFSVITIFLIFLSFNSNLSKRLIFDKNNQINISSENIIIFTAQHTAHYKTGMNMFFDKPWVGHGPKMFRKLCHYENYNEIVLKFDGSKYNGCSSHPHNTYVQLLAETGVIGTIIFSLGFIHVLFILINHFTYLLTKKGKKSSNYQIVINLSAIIVFWPFSPSGNLFNNWMLIIYSLSLCLYVNQYFKYNKV